MRILVLAEVFPPRTGGSGRWLWELYRRLPNVEVIVAAGSVDGDIAFDASSDLAISRLLLGFSSWGLLHFKSGRQYTRALVHLRSIVKNVRPDVLHCGKCLPEGLLAAALKMWTGIPFLTFVHGEELKLAAGSLELKLLTRAVFRTATRVIANSGHTKSILLKDWAVPPEKVFVLNPGVDVSRFVPANADPDLRARLGWTDRRVLLTVGALQKRKGQDMLIRALPAIRARCPDVLYAMAGEGWERGYLEEVARECGVLDIVQFRGSPTDRELIECYQQCDLFVLPNRQVGWDFEGFGIVLIEAQSCGKPVVTGTSGGTPETIRPGDTGELVACDLPDRLADTVAALLDDERRRQRMGHAAREWVLRRFGWDAIVPQALRLFT